MNRWAIFGRPWRDGGTVLMGGVIGEPAEAGDSIPVRVERETVEALNR